MVGRSCLGCPGCPPGLRPSWPSGGAGLGGLTMSEEGGLEEVVESLRSLAISARNESRSAFRASNSVLSLSYLAWSLPQLAHPVVFLDMVRLSEGSLDV